MADLNAIVETLNSLTLLEAAQLKKMLEEKWGVTAVSAAPAAAAAAAPAAAAVVVHQQMRRRRRCRWRRP